MVCSRSSASASDIIFRARDLIAALFTSSPLSLAAGACELDGASRADGCSPAALRAPGQVIEADPVVFARVEVSHLDHVEVADVQDLADVVAAEFLPANTRADWVRLFEQRVELVLRPLDVHVCVVKDLRRPRMSCVLHGFLPCAFSFAMMSSAHGRKSSNVASIARSRSMSFALEVL